MERSQLQTQLLYDFAEDMFEENNAFEGVDFYLQRFDFEDASEAENLDVDDAIEKYLEALSELDINDDADATKALGSTAAFMTMIDDFVDLYY
jgi:hypothetical protein